MMCPYNCPYRSSSGYCSITACIRPDLAQRQSKQRQSKIDLFELRKDIKDGLFIVDKYRGMIRITDTTTEESIVVYKEEKP